MFLDISSFSELDSDLIEQKKEWKSTYKKLLELDSEPVYNEPEPVDEEDSASAQGNGIEETGLEPITLLDAYPREQIKYYIDYLIYLFFDRGFY